MNANHIIEGLRKYNKQPRVHPNGFIQVDINEAERLHCWHPKLPYRQKTYHPIHNHIFTFDSVILTGRLINVRYEPFQWDGYGAAFNQYFVKLIEGQETQLVRSENMPYELIVEMCECLQVGEEYHQDKFTYHETYSQVPTLTRMKKRGTGWTLGPNSEGASVMVPFGVEPDNDFVRAAVDTELLWELINDAARQ